MSGLCLLFFQTRSRRRAPLVMRNDCNRFAHQALQMGEPKDYWTCMEYLPKAADQCVVEILLRYVHSTVVLLELDTREKH